ncbi:hypothetical protein FSP39_023027 [Pinctada imbricata]|uniref:CCD97-like C-terminal domain-containing protein n=1 Tax=Pinctada imbricata TaxID=66713 RepID=A0AA88YCU2_PINIB|nr:hypothetical protein FSP39_023027 [Pinctada imbricata]
MVDDEEEENDGKPKISKQSKMEFRNEFSRIMQERFLAGQDKDFDYKHEEIQDLEDEIHSLESQIISQRGSIMIVSFGVREGALRWLEDTKCQYPMLLDHKRQLYNLFGLKRSVYKTWSISCMIYYAEKMTQGVPLASPYENIHDDPQQMGGDFIMDKDGIMKYLYCSKLSSDRPAVADLIKQLEVCISQ